MIVAQRQVPGIGHLAVRDFEPAADWELAHTWLTDPHAHYWGMQDNTPHATQTYFADIAASHTHDAWLGTHESRPVFLVERYAPGADVIGRFYDVAAGDLGMHILIAPPERPIHGFTWAVFSFVVDTIFAIGAPERLVVEPDAANTAIQRLNARAGFEVAADIDTGDKIARLSMLSRARHDALRAPA